MHKKKFAAPPPASGTPDSLVGLHAEGDVPANSPKGTSALNGDKDENLVTLYTKTNSPKQGIQKFTLEKYASPGQKDRYYLRFMSKSGKYNGCAALYGRNGQYSNGGSPIQMQECEWIDNNGGQRQQIIIPGYGASSGTYTGYLDYVLTQKLCIGPPTGKLNNNKGVAVKSDQCRTKYTVKYL